MDRTCTRIKECRKENHLTQEDVAKHLGIGKQAVYKYEIGAVTNIPLENIEKMALLFNVCPEYLCGWTDEKLPYDPERERRNKDWDSYVTDIINIRSTMSLFDSQLVHAYHAASPAIQSGIRKILGLPDED